MPLAVPRLVLRLPVPLELNGQMRAMARPRPPIGGPLTPLLAASPILGAGVEAVAPLLALRLGATLLLAPTTAPLEAGTPDHEPPARGGRPLP